MKTGKIFVQSETTLMRNFYCVPLYMFKSKIMFLFTKQYIPDYGGDKINSNNDTMILT